MSLRRIALLVLLVGFALNPLVHLHPFVNSGASLQQGPCAFCAAGGTIGINPDPAIVHVQSLAESLVDPPSCCHSESHAAPRSSRAPPTL